MTNKYYYPKSYKLSNTDQDVLRKDFHDFVKKHREWYKNLPIVNILREGSRWIGFIIDDLKDKLVVVTCSHVVDNSADKNSLFIYKKLYRFKKRIGDILLKPKKIYDFGSKNIDLSYIVCDSPFLYHHKQVQFVNDIKKCLVGWYYFDIGDDIRNICDDDRRQFYTWYNLWDLQKVISIDWNEFSIMSANIWDIIDAIKNNQSLLINNDMISRSWMSWWPVISDDGICGMLIWWRKTVVWTLPIWDILKNYNNYIKPTL